MIKTILKELKNINECLIKEDYKTLISKIQKLLELNLSSYLNIKKTFEFIIKFSKSLNNKKNTFFVELLNEAIESLNEVCNNIKNNVIDDDKDLEMISVKMELFLEDLEKENNDDFMTEEDAEEEINLSEFSFEEIEMVLDDFLMEANEIIDLVEEDLLNLQTADKEIINRIFRGMHTLKGSSGMIGLTVLYELAHILEELMGKIREDKILVTTEIEDIFLKGVDIIRHIINQLQEREQPTADINQIIKNVKSILANKPINTDLEDKKTINHKKIENKTNISKPITQSIKKINPNKKVSPTKSTKKSEQQFLRVDTQKLSGLMDEVGELLIEKIRLEKYVYNFTDKLNKIKYLKKILKKRKKKQQITFNDVLKLLYEFEEYEDVFIKLLENIDRATTNLQENAMKLRLVPLDSVFKRFNRLVRDVSNKLGKKIDFQIIGAETEIDKIVCESLFDPLVHIIRNSLDHGIGTPEERRKNNKPEIGTLKLKAYYKGDKVIIEIEDDGKGMNPDTIANIAIKKGVISEEEAAAMTKQEKLLLIFAAGFSTVDKVTDLSGRGVGMDVVRSTIEKLKGSIDLDSREGEGTILTISLPLTLAIVKILLFKLQEDILALPLYNVSETVNFKLKDLYESNGKTVVNLRGEILPIIALDSILGIKEINLSKNKEVSIIIMEIGNKKYGIIVTELLAKREVVIKNLGNLLQKVPFVSGATILGDGEIVLILDPVFIVQNMKKMGNSILNRTEKNITENVKTDNSNKKNILVVDDSQTMRNFLKGFLEKNNFNVVSAENGKDALEKLQNHHFDLISTDIMMPEMDGYEFITNLRQIDKYKKIPVLALSQKEQKVDRIKGFQLGIDEYLIKPTTEDLYINLVKKMIAF